MALESTIEQGRHAWESRPDIHAAPEVLEEIRRDAVNGFHAFGHGGIEIGGALFGVREAGAVRVLAFEPLDCEHAHGPSFVLSPKDRQTFEALLRGGPEGMEPLGWYCSHTRRGLDLDAGDSEIFDRFFPKPGAIALIVQPDKLGPARTALYRRDADGQLRSLGAPGEAVLEPSRPRRIATVPPPIPATAPQDASEPEPVDVNTAGEAALPEYPEARTPRREFEEAAEEAIRPEYPRERAPRRLSLAWLWLPLIILIAVATVAAFSWLRPPAPKLGLHARAAGEGQVRIEWDRASAAALNPVSGLLRINDGPSNLTLPLSTEQLLTGSVTYVHETGGITVQLHLERKGGAPLDESLQYSGRPATPVEGPAVPPATPETAGRAAPARSERPAQPQRPELPLPPRTESAQPDPAPQQTVEPPRRLAQFSPPPLVLPQASQPAALPPAPQAAPPAAEHELSLTLPSSAPALPERPKPSYTGPRSGRIIWTGSLDRRGVVEIDAARSSIGSITGSLPGVAVTFRVSPAEFSEDGLIVYTAEPGRNGRVEPADRGNGWNRTRFELAPDRTALLSVLEAPNASNHFARIALRNDGRACSVIVIDWTTR